MVKKHLIYIIRQIIVLALVYFYPGLDKHELQAQKITVDEYIETYKDIAIEEMNKFHIPASITLAQGILESGTGNSELARKANNHFGIKCHNEWDGKTFHMDDDAKHECFRKYKHPEESYKDHSAFLSGRDRYAFLFKLDPDDYKSWAKGLKKAGYATNPRYPELLIKIIEENRLFIYDQGYKGEKAIAREEINDKSDIIKEEALPEFSVDGASKDGRQVFENNGSRLIYVRKGDTYNKIAAEFGIYRWQIYKYNELKRNSVLHPGQIIYIEKKKAKSDIAFHILKKGETLHDVSQLYGIRLKKLIKLNAFPKDYQPETGEKVILK